MNKAIAVAMLAAGIVLTIFGVNEMNSFSSDVSRWFTGSPTDHSIWMLVIGILIGVAGLFGLVSGKS
jgi:hypothetical protein